MPSDFAKKIRESLGVTEEGVDQLFEVGEDKQGFFIAKLKPKQYLETAQFKTMCALARDLGGEGYLQGAKAWSVPGPLAKKPSVAGDAQEPGVPVAKAERGPSGVTPECVSADKRKPPELGPLPVRLGYHEKFSVQYIISPKFTFRMHIEDDIQELIEQISTTQAGGELCVIAEPLICRPASKSGYIEVGAGERRLLAAKKMDLGAVPVIIKNFTDEEFDRIRMMENLARKDLTDYEVARALKYLMDTYPKTYPTQANVAEVFGKSREWVTQRLQMLRLESDNVTRVTMESGEMTERQAREILAAPEEKRAEILERISESGEVPSARELEQMRKPSIPCHRCGEPVSEPVYVRGEFYCGACATIIGSEKEPVETSETVEHAKASKVPEPKPLLTGFEVECPECKKKLLINHIEYPGGRVDHEVELQ